MCIFYPAADAIRFGLDKPGILVGFSMKSKKTVEEEGNRLIGLVC